MNTQITKILILLCLLTGTALTAQTNALPPDVEGLRDFLLTDLAYQEYPEDPFIWVVFFDIDHDGIPDALATYKGNDYTGTGGGGYLWHFYRFKDGKWQRGPLEETEDSIFDPNTVYSASDGFFSLTREGKKPTLIASYPFRGKEFDIDFARYTESQDASEVTIDNEGYLKTIPLPELTWRVVDIYDKNGNIVIASKIDPKKLELKKQLVPVPVTVLNPREKPENGKSSPVATTGQEGGAQASSPSREGEAELGMRNGELGIEKEKANRLWHYLGVSLLALCALVYFVRRKKEN